MSEGPGSGEIDRAEGGVAGGSNGGEGAVRNARAEGEVEVGDREVAAEDGGEEVDPERFEGFAVAGLDCVEGFADEGEGFEVERGIGGEEVEDGEEDFVREEVEDGGGGRNCH